MVRLLGDAYATDFRPPLRSSKAHRKRSSPQLTRLIAQFSALPFGLPSLFHLLMAWPCLDFGRFIGFSTPPFIAAFLRDRSPTSTLGWWQCGQLQLGWCQWRLFTGQEVF